MSIAGVSAFGSLPLNAEFKGFGRFDIVSHDAEDTSDLLFITGLDYAAATDVHLMPNVLIESARRPRCQCSRTADLLLQILAVL